MTNDRFAIRGGQVVTPSGITRMDIAIESGRIVAVGDTDGGPTVDASGLLIFPGMIDVHVHLLDPAEPDRETIETGTAAAAAAGVTTIVEHSHPTAVQCADAFRAKVDFLSRRALVDFGVGAHFPDDDLDAIPAMAAEGAAFIKVLTCGTPFTQSVSYGRLSEGMRRFSDLGIPFLIHAEDCSLVDTARERLVVEGRHDGALVREWRQPLAERAAASVVAMIAVETGAVTVLAHCTSAEIVDCVVAARVQGARMYAETCPQYFTFRADEVDRLGGLRKFTPPARASSPDDFAAMWSRVEGGGVDYFASDHAPASRETKQNDPIWSCPFGLPGLDTTFRFLLDAAARGNLSYGKVADLCSQAPARIYGLSPRKGAILPGADADLVMVDPTALETLQDEHIVSKAGWSPFSGREFHGRVVATYLRGKRVAADGKPLAGPGTGRFMPIRRGV